ncbi:MAG: hypothetical protein KatS3mg060_2977 [Dehalococcoidia bacterium]|nr:MAG: hypothetical protein KatS3mg060_2977 [Dehalococcoidia bacterium]
MPRRFIPLAGVVSLLLVAPVLPLLTHPAIAVAQEPGAGCRELDSAPRAGSRQALHTAYPCSRFDVPAASSVLTSTATIQVQGRSSANCEPNRQGVPTYVESVELQLGATANWQKIGFTSYDNGCFATWSTVWGLPRVDNQPIVLRARTTAFHGLPDIFTLFTEEPPASHTVRVDTIAPRVTLNLPPFLVGDRIPVVWSAVDGAGIRDVQVEYDAGAGWTLWQAGQSGAAVFGPTLPVPVQPGVGYRFRARATDGNGLTSDWTAASETRIVPGEPRVFVPLGQVTRRVATGD